MDSGLFAAHRYIFSVNALDAFNAAKTIFRIIPQIGDERAAGISL